MAIKVRRLLDRPVVHAGMLPPGDGANINGPSLIYAPEWLPGRLGNFYLYFAHHHGRYIRLAYADRLEGPWQVYLPGTLHLRDAPMCDDHIASPDVHVDEANRQIVMFFHGPALKTKVQKTFLARSSDGIRFSADPRIVGGIYFRCVPWRGAWVGMAMGGAAYAASHPFGQYRALPRPRVAPGPSVRHVALRPNGDRLEVYFSRIGDAPERILMASLSTPDGLTAEDGPAFETVLAPERDWEGARLPVTSSESGAAYGPENALRDPAIFAHAGRTYLLYAAAGESGIGIAEVID
jgi:hypothetical protein